MTTLITAAKETTKTQPSDFFPISTLQGSFDNEGKVQSASGQVIHTSFKVHLFHTIYIKLT